MTLLPLSALAVIGIAGCGANKDAAIQDRYTDMTQPIGYYSNEKHDNNRGNVTILDQRDNDGPVTEIMDHTFGDEGRTNNIRGYDLNARNGISNEPFRIDNRPLPDGNNRISDANKLARKIEAATESVENVKNARVQMNRDKVIIYVDYVNNDLIKKTEMDINQIVMPYVGKKVVKITNDQRNIR